MNVPKATIMHLEIHFSLILSIWVIFCHTVGYFVAPFLSINPVFPLKTKNSFITVRTVRWELVTGQ